MSVAGIVLAAGFSRRLGRPKQTVTIHGETLLARAVRVAREAGLDPVLAVVQPQASFLPELHALPCTLVANQEAEEGIASSIRAGVRAANGISGVDGAILMTCDQIGTAPAHLRSLYAQAELVTGSGYAGKVAIPAYFPRSTFEQLLALQGDTGARSLLQAGRSIEAESLRLDIDTEDDVARARLLF